MVFSRVRAIPRLVRLMGSPRLLFRAVRQRNRPPRYRSLQTLVAEVRPRTILEIGLFRGETARMMIATALRHGSVEYWGLDVFAEGMTEELLIAEASKRPLSAAEVYDGLSDLAAKVTLVAGDSTKTLPVLELPAMDFVFIDGGHSYETVATDWANVKRILAVDGVAVFDDYTNSAAVVHEDFGVRRLIDEIAAEQEWDVQLLEPVDRFERPWGVLETQLVRVQRASGSPHANPEA